MADIQVEDKNKKGKKPKLKKVATHVDFTPMVDLGFLLITFFMLATSMVKPQTMEISVPAKSENLKEEDQNKVKASQAITILIDQDNGIYYYFGTAENGVDPQLVESNYSSSTGGIREMLVQRNIDVIRQINQLKADTERKLVSEEEYTQKLKEYKESKTAPTVLIMATEESTYKNLVDVLDEMHICNIARYAIVDITPYDTGLIEKFKSGQ